MADLFENPIGTDGFEFLEYTGKDIAFLENLMKEFGFTATGRHKTKNITLYQQGKVNFLINAETTGQPKAFADEHNGGASAMGFRVRDKAHAYAEAKKRGAEIVHRGRLPRQTDRPLPRRALRRLSDLRVLRNRRGSQQWNRFGLDRPQAVDGVEVDRLVRAPFDL